MSIGDRKTEGSKGGSNYSWQSKVLLGLQKIIESNGGNPDNPTALTPGVQNITNAVGTTPSTWKSFTVVCLDGIVEISSQEFPPGAYTFSNDNGTLNGVTYDATASADCKIIYVI
tara:strand:+ start:367 stop:711 length:345 start_codon:yes stop_codon:yes gene_type:complete